MWPKPTKSFISARLPAMATCAGCESERSNRGSDYSTKAAHGLPQV